MNSYPAVRFESAIVVLTNRLAKRTRMFLIGTDARETRIPSALPHLLKSESGARAFVHTSIHVNHHEEPRSVRVVELCRKQRWWELNSVYKIGNP